ncbi:GmrSD restriction endonuclease domain-containing protein [Brachybacterium huguangmaarense]
MRATESSLSELLEGTKQYQVPLYQRTYSWGSDQHARLWEDLVHLADERRDHGHATHFMGSLVLAPSPSNGPTGVQRFLVVDGQQRLTTLSILLVAIRDHRAATENPEHRDRINEQYLENKWLRDDARLKLFPTQADRDAYRACVSSTADAGGTDGIGEAYRYFSSRLSEATASEDEFDIQLFEEAVLNGLSLVTVVAQEGDNVHRIFESLNNTGLKLSQGDLLRNYIFMRLENRSEEAYVCLWLPLQESLKPEHLELLFWLDLVQDDPKARQTSIYADHVARLERVVTEQELVDELARFRKLGTLLGLILDPGTETDPDVRLRLTRLQAWGTTTVYPLLLHLLERRAKGASTSEQIAAAMLSVESFLVRRLLIGRATANINRTLLATTFEVRDEDDVAAAVHRYLSAGRKYFASDAEIRESLSTVPFYLNGRSNQRKLVLQWIEESYGSREPGDPAGLTIEHVMPRTATDAWRSELKPELRDGESFEDVHQSLLHTLGNLTLTGYNSTLSNSPFGVKREHLKTSGLRMNRDIAAHDKWGRDAIEKRAQVLAERISEIWPAPDPDAHADELPPSWQKLARVIAEIPPGAWTSYGDLAALIGSHPVPVGAYISRHPIPHGHRVLQGEGSVSPGFRWFDRKRSEDPIELLADSIRPAGQTLLRGSPSRTSRISSETARMTFLGLQTSRQARAPHFSNHSWSSLARRRVLRSSMLSSRSFENGNASAGRSPTVPRRQHRASSSSARTRSTRSGRSRSTRVEASKSSSSTSRSGSPSTSWHIEKISDSGSMRFRGSRSLPRSWLSGRVFASHTSQPTKVRRHLWERSNGSSTRSRNIGLPGSWISDHLPESTESGTARTCPAIAKPSHTAPLQHRCTGRPPLVVISR